MCTKLMVRNANTPQPTRVVAANKKLELRNYRKSLTPFFPATVFLGPLRVRELVRVR